MNGQKEDVASAAPTSHPTGFYFIFWGEFAERCSYYGMRAILLLYLTTVFLYEDGPANRILSSFKSACYFLPLLGGFISDRYFGKYWTIVGFSVPYVLGHFVLGIETNMALFIALVLLACGSGVTKPNISTLRGKTYDQRRPGQKALLTSAFLWFYFSINIGAVLSQYGLPQMRDSLVNSQLKPYELREETQERSNGEKQKVWTGIKDGVRGKMAKKEVDALYLEARRYAYPLTFQVPAWLMVAALAAFATGKRHYANEPAHPGRLISDVRLLISYFIMLCTGPARLLAMARQALGGRGQSQHWEVLTRLFGVFFLIIFFWVAYEQNDNLWTFFARDHIQEKVIDKTTGLEITTCVLRLGSWEKHFPPDGFQFINAFLILFLVPLSGVLWRKLDPTGSRIPPTRKILAGFVWTAGAAGIMSLASHFASDGTLVSAWWMVLGYFVLTVGEILVYGTGLELSYRVAPESMKGFVTACFLVTNTLGNLINVELSPLYAKRIPEARFFAMTAGIVLVAATAFFFVGRRFEGRSTAVQASN